MVSTDGRTDGRTDTEGYNIIPRHTLVAGYKKTSFPFLDITIMEIENLKYFTHVYEQAAVHLI